MIMTESISKLIDEALDYTERNKMLLAAASPSMAKVLARLCQEGYLIRPQRGLYVRRDTWNELTSFERYLMRIRTLSSLHPEWVFCSYSAAVVHGIEPPRFAMNRIHIISSGTRTNPGIHRHHCRNVETEVHNRIRVVTIEHAAQACIEEMPFPYALGIADAALRVKNLEADDLIHALGRLQRKHEQKAYAADVIPYADKRSENGGESYARAIMIEQGVMLPDLQVEHYDPICNCVYRDDYEWDLASYRVSGELDGKQKYTKIAREQGKTIEDVMREERQRESRLRNLGMKFARFNFNQVRQVHPFLSILDSCGIPRIGPNSRAPRKP